MRRKYPPLFVLLWVVLLLVVSGCAGSVQKADGVPADGTYTPSLFTVQGGTGKVTISCEEVSIEEGAAEAEIVFSSPHYEWLKSEGVTYEPLNGEQEGREDSVFRIPVRLEEEMTVSGLTTAMSEPHEIEYTVFISLGKESPEKESPEEEEPSGEAFRPEGGGADEGPLQIGGLTCVSSMEPEYAQAFDVYTYVPADGEKEAEGRGAGFHLIDVHGSGRYLLVPENGAVPEELPEDVTVLRAPLRTLYVAATSSMALFDAAGAIGQVKLTGTKAEGWYIDAPKKALEEGSMVYAGKYSAPDYELLASSGCDLAVESMMILHTPEVKEKLEELGIPVFIDTSSAESHPLGRTEWIRLYGVLTGHETEADAFFEKQKELFAESETYTDTGLTVAFFSISSGGNVIVRAADDYIPRMIELSGGRYIFADLLAKSGNSASVRLSMEDFYNTAKDADYLIYNATIENPVRSLSELCGKSALLQDFKAVQEGHVWQVQRSLYQSPDIAAQMITDMHRMLSDGMEGEMVFLEKVE